MRTLALMAIVSFSLTHAGSALASEAPATKPMLEPNPQIDYAGFELLTQNLREYRQNRLISMDQFVALAKEDNAIILDTRSVGAFQFGHIEGAINLPFSDFTDEKLAKILGDKTRPVLIYCNNNFRDNVFPIARKSAPLALNIPTFINLYGYGYQNIYELNDVVQTSDSRVNWVPLKIDG